LGRADVRKRRSRLLPALAAALVLSVILLAFREPILTRLGELLVVSDPLERADLIYVLAGDFWGGRVLLGANLGSQGWAPRVILSGGRYQNSYASDLALEFAVQHGYRRSLFLPIRMETPSTLDEARAMGPMFRRLGAKRIILVTSNFHSRRAVQVFRLFCPQFDFRMEAAGDDTFDPRAWWKTPGGRHLLFGEYQKMLGTYLVRWHLAGASWLQDRALERGPQ
jgi:uncharacterized SAM-binding protein YcdF (DUF218 family)